MFDVANVWKKFSTCKEQFTDYIRALFFNLFQVAGPNEQEMIIGLLHLDFQNTTPNSIFREPKKELAEPGLKNTALGLWELTGQLL